MLWSSGIIQVTFSLVVLDFHTRFIYVLFDVVFTFSFICSSNNPYCCETYFFKTVCHNLFPAFSIMKYMSVNSYLCFNICCESYVGVQVSQTKYTLSSACFSFIRLTKMSSRILPRTKTMLWKNQSSNTAAKKTVTKPA